ncbi:putative cullin domain-containing protein [Encephalitozoon hellem]|uniref:Cullin domain-containing protein n=1 Tax=Encephalitozoon hellem TaxID=27973 RepID=A0A9Q9CAL2_ENCHE|nr:putative cullin domain-containing protein [Encephalitozoon hellem]
MKDCNNQQLRESVAAMKNFVQEHLNKGVASSTCEEIYQVSWRMARRKSCRKSLKVIRRASKTFVDGSIEKAREVDSLSIGKYLYDFNFHWSRSMDLFSKVFNPIAPVEKRFIARLSPRLFARLVKGIEDKIVEFLTHNIKEEIEGKRRIKKPNESAPRVWEHPACKKQKLNQSSANEPGNKHCEKKMPDEFELLCRERQISVIICILQDRGCFDMFSERIIECLISVFSSKIYDENLDILSIKDLIDRYRKVEYMKGYFYAVESGLMRRVVMNYTSEEVFGMLNREDEMRLCVGFFCASGSEKRLMEVIDMYCKEVIKSLSIDRFIEGYYWIYLKFKEIEEDNRDDWYQKIRKGIKRCKKEVVNTNADCAIESICAWTDSLLRGRITIKEDIIEGMEHRIRVPGTNKEDRVDTRKVLKSTGMVEVNFEGSVWREFLLSNIFEMIGEIFHFCDNKEVFETALRNKLGNRLISRSSVSTHLESLLIDRIDPGKTQLNKMRCMIKDFTEKKLFMGHEILLLRSCKWPRYEEASLGIRDVEEIKERYKEVEKNRRKIVRWNDLLSSCEIEFLGRTVTVTLAQYLIIKLLAEKDRDIESLKVCKTWNENLEILMKKELVRVEEGKYSLNLGFWEENSSVESLIPHSFALQGQPEATRIPDGLEPYKDLLDCKIVKEMKANKILSKSKLRELLGQCHPSEMFDERIESLANREFLSIEGENIKYLP